MPTPRAGETQTDAQQLERLENAADDAAGEGEGEPVYVLSDEEEEDEDDEEDEEMYTGHGLLASLSTDVATYVRKVEEQGKGKDTVDSETKPEAPESPEEVSAGSKRKQDDEDYEEGSAKDDDDEEDDHDVSEEESGHDAKRPRPNKRQSQRQMQLQLQREKQATELPLSPPPSLNRPTKKGARGWSKSEDDAIVYYKEELQYSWRKIEQLLEYKHTWQAIQMRYLRNHKSRNDEWARYMEVKFVKAVQKDWENRWKRIAADLGPEFTTERCITKNIDMCKKIEFPYYASIFDNKEVRSQYKTETEQSDIKDPETHKKLMLVYLGLDAISYDDSDNEQDKAEEEGAIEPQQQGEQAVPETAEAAVAAVDASATASDPAP